MRRFTWTCRDALEQFDKLRSVFDAAAYTGEYFQNRGLFSDYFLRDRLREDLAWRDNPSETFAFARDLMRDAQVKWTGKDKDTLKNQLLEPLFKKLGFKVNRPGKTTLTEPDYLLSGGTGVPPVRSGGTPDPPLTAAFVYAWDRWLDGPDLNDTDTPEENPGACVVTALDVGAADWIMVTNGRLWRLYSRQARARATNFYSDVAERLDKVYSPKDTTIYDHLCTLFVAMDKGDPILNVPTYNGGLFGHGGSGVSPDWTGGTPVPPSKNRDQRIARFLTEHKVPDRYLALAIDHLARDQDERTLALVFIDYKSLEVRHLGSKSLSLTWHASCPKAAGPTAWRWSRSCKTAWPTYTA